MKNRGRSAEGCPWEREALTPQPRERSSPSSRAHGGSWRSRDARAGYGNAEPQAGPRATALLRVGLRRRFKNHLASARKWGYNALWPRRRGPVDVRDVAGLRRRFRHEKRRRRPGKKANRES